MWKTLKSLPGMAHLPRRVSLNGAVVPTARLTVRAVEHAANQLHAQADAAYASYDAYASGSAYRALLGVGVDELTAKAAVDVIRAQSVKRINALGQTRLALCALVERARCAGAGDRDRAAAAVAAAHAGAA